MSCIEHYFLSHIINTCIEHYVLSHIINTCIEHYILSHIINTFIEHYHPVTYHSHLVEILKFSSKARPNDWLVSTNVVCEFLYRNSSFANNLGKTLMPWAIFYAGRN